jgi:hypothetical protein
LAGLTSAVCPECATPISAGLPERSFSQLGDAFAFRVRWGLRLLLVSLVLTLAGLVAFVWTMVLPLDHPRAPGLTVAWAALEAPGLVMWCVGWWLVTAREGWASGRHNFGRWIARVLMCVHALLGVFVAMQYPVADPVYFQPLVIVSLYPVRILTPMVCMGSFSRLARLAGSPLARRFDRLQVVLFGCIVVGIISLAFVAIDPFAAVVPAMAGLTALVGACIAWPYLLVRLLRDIREHVP